MPETAAKQGDWSQLKRQADHSTGYAQGLQLRSGLYAISRLLQDKEAVAYFSDGSIRGQWRPSGDIQSDDIGAPSGESIPRVAQAYFDAIIQQLSRNGWEFKKSFTNEESMEPVATEISTLGQDIDATLDDVSQWTPAQLASAILQADVESDMPKLREMILVAEDTGFAVGQSNQLAPWLLSFAERHRDSNDPQDEAAVWSAIRTGASMLTPDAAGSLRLLLEPGHSIETSLVTVKMLGRIFEAQPPTDVDQHMDLAAEVRQIADSLLNRYAITISQSAAMVHLAIYALVAMADGNTQGVVETVRGLGVAWFTRRTTRKLRELRDTWASRPTPVSDGPRGILDNALQTLEQD